MRGELVGMAWLLGLGGVCLPPEASGQETGRRSGLPVEGARKVVAAVVRAAEANARLPRRGAPRARPPFRREGDVLTTYYVRAAAAEAGKLPKEQAAGAFLLALGVALDDSEVLRGNPLMGPIIRTIESDARRKKRLAVLGGPTMRGRRDLAQHFVVSCALTELVGAVLAESAGLLKEQKDMRSGSGFSFADLQADLAGIALAVRLKKGELLPGTLAKRFRVEDFLPAHAGLPEGLKPGPFARDYGSLVDRRFRAEVEKLRERIRSLPGHR